MTQHPTDSAPRAHGQGSSGRRHSRKIQEAPGISVPRQFGPRSLKIGLAAVSSALLLATGIGYSTIGNLNNNIAGAGDLSLGNQPDGATDILLVGVDSRTDAQGKPLSQRELNMLRAGEEEATNTDTMILIRVPNDGSSATAVSLPRDTYVNTPSMGNMKLNGVYGSAKFEKSQALAKQNGGQMTPDTEKKSTEAGRQELISSVADLTGIHVDHYAEVGLLGFVLLTDAVGGVDVCLNQAVDEPLSGAKFPKGYQTLNGPDALSFVRQRHDLPRGDLDRITRQQAYMASLANHILSSETLTNPSSLNEINTAVQRSVVLDNNWDIMGMATQMQNLAGGNVSFQTIPVTSIDGTGDNGESIVTVDKNQVHKFFKDLAGTPATEEKPFEGAAADPQAPIEAFNAGDYTIDVLNGGEIPGLASTVGNLVKGYGYKLGQVGNASQTGISKSQVNVAHKDDPAARALARQLGGLDVVEDPSLKDKEVSVTLAGNYTGPGAFGETVKLQDPNSPLAGTHTEGVKDLDGDGAADGDAASGTSNSGGSTASPGVVGTQGGTPDQPQLTKPIDAGSKAPMCVN